jgi:hypothetical protein
VRHLQQSNPSAFVLQLPADVLHIDRFAEKLINQTLEEKIALWTPHYTEWYLLFKMDGLIISRSGFSETAAWSTGVPTIAFYKSKGACMYRLYEDDKEPLVWW